MGKAFAKDIRRSITGSVGRFLAIAVISALGCGFYAGLRMTAPDMKLSGDMYYDSTNTADIRVVSTLGLEDDDIARIASIEGVKSIMPERQLDALATLDGVQYTLRVHSLDVQAASASTSKDGWQVESDDDSYINRLVLVDGRWPEEEGECVLYADAVLKTDVAIGDVIELGEAADDVDVDDSLCTRTLKICGFVRSGWYPSSTNLGSTSLGAGELDTICYVAEDDFLDDMPYSGAYITVEGAEELNAASDEYDACVQEVADRLTEAAGVHAQARLDDVKSDAQGELDENRETYESEKADAQGELDDAKSQLDEAEEELADAQSELDDAAGELDDAKSQLDEAADELADAKSQLDDAEEELASGRSQLDDGWAELEESASQLDAARDEYEAGVAELESQRAEAQAQIEAAQAQIDEGRQALAQAQAALPQMQEAIAQYNSAIAALESSIEAIDSQIGALSAADPDDPQIAALEQQRVALSEQMTAAATERDALQAQIDQVEATASQLDAAQAELDAQQAGAQEQLDAAQAQLDEAARQIEEGAAQLAEGEEQLEQSEEEYADGLAEYEDGKQQYEEGLAEYEDGLAEYEDGLAEYEDAYNEAQEGFADAEAELADAQQEIDDLELPDWHVLDRSKNIGIESFRMDADRVDQIARVFPFLFFLVAALVSLTTMTRMVDEERVLIGTYKALGYSNASIIAKYLAYALIACGIGAVVGIVALSLFLPAFIMDAYSIVYAVPPRPTPIDPAMSLASGGMGVAITLIATLAAAWSSLKEQPASLMLPRAPKAGKRILLERISPIWSRMSFIQKVTARNIFRYKRRFFMAVIGIAGCTALMLTGFGLQNAINDIIDKQWGELYHYSLTVRCDDDATQGDISAVEAILSDPQNASDYMTLSSQTMIAIEQDGHEQHLSLEVPSDPSQLSSYITIRERVGHEDLALTDGSAIISEKLATKLGISIGDELVLYEQDVVGNATGDGHAITVGGIMENYVSQYAFITPATYEEVFGEAAQFSTYYAKATSDSATRSVMEDELLAIGGVATAGFNDETISSYRTMLTSVDAVVVVLIIAAAALAFVVLYNLTNINITERVREIATLKVLGFTPGEVNAYIYRETLLLSLIGAIVGCFLGIFMEGFVVTTAEVDQVMFGREIHASSFAIAFALTMVFSLIVTVVMRRKLNKIDMIESLKSIE